MACLVSLASFCGKLSIVTFGRKHTLLVRTRRRSERFANDHMRQLAHVGC